MCARVFIDGDQGATVPKKLGRLSGRRELSLVALPETLRKDAAAGAAAITDCDLAVRNLVLMLGLAGAAAERGEQDSFDFMDSAA
ncbi:MAG TPA: hypothetical protein VFL86_21405 [Burkholderiaceae bacterium]|nr:hypothetical protein [Burkholderiaceae bacterium]